MKHPLDYQSDIWFWTATTAIALAIGLPLAAIIIALAHYT